MNSSAVRSVILVQLPIPPVGPEPIRGNVPLAAGYLKLFARQRGLESHFQIEILPTIEANVLGDQALVEAVLARDPWMVGFTCYLWNIERTLWVAAEIKRRKPGIRILIGGPEVTLDNAWVLEHPAVDYAAIGEGEQTFAELLEGLLYRDELKLPIPGLIFRDESSSDHRSSFVPRQPLPNLNEISSPYLAGILDAADEEMLLMETIRGCIFKCKFCYYPKSYDDLYFVSEEKIVANLEHARRRGAKEVVLLDPTLNQRRNFGDFLRLLARCNPGRQFTYFGELRAEGITPQIAELLHAANFTEVEIGLQSIDPLAMELMDRHNNLKAFERGARAMLDLGIQVKVDLIIGLPGDTVDSVRRGLEYIHRSGLYSQVQVFNLAVLPGTAFREQAQQLGLMYQDRPPYYVLQTPALSTDEMYDLMAEAEDLFETEFDPLPEVRWPLDERAAQQGATDSGAQLPLGVADNWEIDLDDASASMPPQAANRSQAFTLHLRSSNFHLHRQRAAELVERLLADNPFSTLQIVLEPVGQPEHLTPGTCNTILEAALKYPTYLDRFYSVQPGRFKGAKRMVVVLPSDEVADSVDENWRAQVGRMATLVTASGMPATSLVEVVNS